MGIATCFALAWCFGHLFNKTFKHMLNDMHGNSSLTISSFQSIINSTSLWTQTVGLCPLMPTHWNHPSCQPGHSWCQHLACRTCLIVRDAEGGEESSKQWGNVSSWVAGEGNKLVWQVTIGCIWLEKKLLNLQVSSEQSHRNSTGSPSKHFHAVA